MNVRIEPKKLRGVIDAIPSKSHAHRVLIAQKLAQLSGQRKADSLTIPTFSEDIGATRNCLVQMDKEMPFLDCKESGSTLRFMLPVAMALKDEAVFIGSGKLPYRPISPLKEEMEAHGCRFIMGSKEQRISDKYKEICTVRGRLQAGEYELAGNISSQFITGLLFALPLLEGNSVLRLTTRLESAGYVDMTLAVIRSFGVRIDTKKSDEGFEIYEIPGNQRYVEPDDLVIEGDWSNASFWLACGALGGDITVRGLDPDSTQRDKSFLDILKEMGAEVLVASENPSEAQDDGDCSSDQKSQTADISPGNALITCRGGVLKGADVSVEQTPDMVPVLAAVMSAAENTSMITHAERLKLKESDRLKSVCDFLSRLGADITYGGSGISLTGLPSLRGGEVDGHNDHRIVMAAAVASCICTSPVIIRGVEAVKKSYPDFFDDFASLGGSLREI